MCPHRESGVLRAGQEAVQQMARGGRGRRNAGKLRRADIRQLSGI